ncbi:hypothetical protein [Natronococcus roseus]|uniref:hypothetical protein n=1 Tax=Natronococcus roseus TaxID=1052014 RepID=UPI00374C9906
MTSRKNDVERLRGAEGSVTKVIDERGSSWRAYVDDVEIVPISAKRSETDGELFVVTEIEDGEWDEYPGDVMPPNLIAREVNGSGVTFQL